MLQLGSIPLQHWLAVLVSVSSLSMSSLDNVAGSFGDMFGELLGPLGSFGVLLQGVSWALFGCRSSTWRGRCSNSSC